MRLIAPAQARTSREENKVSPSYKRVSAVLCKIPLFLIKTVLTVSKIRMAFFIPQGNHIYNKGFVMIPVILRMLKLHFWALVS
jgi:hypothetical protein